MPRAGNRKAQKKEGHQSRDKTSSKISESPEELKDVGISGNKNSPGNTDEQNSPSVTKPVVKQSQKNSNTKLRRKILKKKESGVNFVNQEMDDSEDGEISFNFKAGNIKEAEASTKTDSVELANVTGTSVEKPVQMLSKTRSAKGNQEAHSKSHEVSMGPVSNQELVDVTMDTNQVQEETTVKKQPHADSNEGKKQSGVKQKSRKRKASRQENDIPMKKAPKIEDIFFYCGNLPPGVTRETLKYFLQEEGIHPRVFIKRMKGLKHAPTDTLTPKQKLYKKNQLKAAKSLFATVIVKTEEEAKKMMLLNGITMPSPSSNDWETELKIVRRLPRPRKFPYKVHVGGLHPGINEDELRQYLESCGITPGHVVIIRTHRTQKSRRYGFVWFESVPDADKAVDLPEPSMRDRPLVIQHSFKKTFKNF
ncbi:uncharacterized protein LOC119732609 isoform X2 [Patiria miniata]|nr:uncharacterized protein LOC119732609 isoform X2 [Patiria miniata]XP_038062114.1 uncharacterized protein LOC119732609 isoform X2 [Patiria miniata]XP_038062115.1 uncharacterized protein LOC119732609 isoform X2 [Patiria miniata]XP_038062116.1 uncharacterized protein LOC119732609 isoform X2 [Patiria miniata]XP_038062117.1 uncharacterized protein LOC119732609 isoform X2 [Patiria miniata]XP_038062118.1 uncharacterized protein LOC119732609 isoform X2 [Patiria miniata]XP_038062119.1 uncharacterize